MKSYTVKGYQQQGTRWNLGDYPASELKCNEKLALGAGVEILSGKYAGHKGYVCKINSSEVASNK